MLYIYMAMFILSFASIIYVGLHNFKNIEPFFWAISMVIPASILGYILMMTATTQEGIALANNVAFIDSTLLISLIFSGILKEMKVKIHNAIKAFIYITNLGIYILSVLPFSKGWYYAGIDFDVAQMGNIINIKAGPLMIFHKFFLVVMIFSLFIVRVNNELKRKKSLNRILRSYYIMVEIAMTIYIIQEWMGYRYNWLPVVYGLGLAHLSFNYKGKFVHDIDAIVTNVFERKDDCGYVAFDLNHRLVAFNDYIVKLFPEFEGITVDSVIPSENERLCSLFELGQKKISSGNHEPVITDIDGRLYKVSATYFYVAKNDATAGTVFKIEDYTDQHIQDEFITRYDENLHNEVDKQLRNIKKKYHKVERCLADIIENRDCTTGGHVKRTGDAMQIVVNTMAEHKIANFTYEFAEDMSRAAVLHDIGKISISESVLCKPGKLTLEEFEQIKLHTIKGSEIVKEMYEGNESAHLCDTVYNVARYHHERYDGTGYPEGLKGDDIPIEARIMALVDAYDAMVTDRCYKEKMSYKEAEREVMACMGTQFDPILKNVFSLCKAQLENYYRELQN